MVTFCIFAAALTSLKRISDEVAQIFFPESYLFPSCKTFFSFLIEDSLNNRRGK
jgi:hypothetical protein